MTDHGEHGKHRQADAMPVAPKVASIPQRSRRRRVLIAGVVAASVGLFAAAAFGVVHGADAVIFHTSDLKPLQARLEAMPCITWAEGASEFRSVDVGEVAFEEFGISSRCSTGDIIDAYAVAAHYVDEKVQPGNGRIQISALAYAAPLSAHAAEGSNLTAAAQMVIDPQSDKFPAGSTMEPYVKDWLSVRKTIDPNAQLDGSFGTDEYHSTPDERFTINTTTPALPSVSASLSARLKEASWRVTFAPVGHTALTQENSSPPGALTVETNRGLPDALSLAVGRGLDGAWPSKTAGAQQYISEYRDFEDETTPTVTHEPLDSLSVEVFGVAPSQSYAPPTGSNNTDPGPATDTALIPPEKTTAWPAITHAIDALSASGHPFGFGLELSSHTFTTGGDYSLTEQTTDFMSGLATVSSLGCVPVDPTHLSTDANVVEQSLYNYWSSQGRPGLMVMPGETCPV